MPAEKVNVIDGHIQIYTWSQLNLSQLNLIIKDRNQWKLYSHVSTQSGYTGESGI